MNQHPQPSDDDSLAVINTNRPSPADLHDLNLDQIQGDSITRYVVVEINRNLYGLSTDTTVELMVSGTSQITRVPHSPDYILGVINHRGTIIPVIDMRSLLGFEQRSAESAKLTQHFETLKNDHVNWLNALDDAVFRNQKFTLSTDPCKCNFGIWQQSVLNGKSPMSAMIMNDPFLKSFLEECDAPHTKIHAVAEQALALKAAGKNEEASAKIESVRNNELQQLVSLFERIQSAIRAKFNSMLVITEVGTRKAAIAVDAVSFVADCRDDTIEPLPDTADNAEFLSGLVHQPNGKYILIADLEHIYNTACPAK